MILLCYLCAPIQSMFNKKIFRQARYLSFFLVALAAPAIHVVAQTSEAGKDISVPDSTHTSRVNLHFQTTYIYQYQPAFSAAYSGQNSMKNVVDKENSITATLNLGIKLWKGAEFYINPEIAGGSGLSGAYGLAASTNGETFRVGDPSPTLYLARAMLVQTIQLGAKGDTFIAEAANETGGMKPRNYLKFYLGKMSLGDLFDVNSYSNNPRSQFMNWCLMYNGAWDYAANLRGYTYAFATVLQEGNMGYKLALATLPVVANGADLNTNLNQEYSLNGQVERAYKLVNKPGMWRLLGYYNYGDMGNYAQAIKNILPGDVPDLVSTREQGRTKIGFGLNAEQQINDYIGLFARLGWNDGKNETWCFTEADQSISAGISINGNKWQRKDDVIGFAVDVNGLSASHRQYLADGGLGFQLGDGRLSYANESAAELYYNYKLTTKNLWLSGDYQLVVNPGYNSDRGPVNVFSFRLHVEL